MVWKKTNLGLLNRAKNFFHWGLLGAPLSPSKYAHVPTYATHGTNSSDAQKPNLSPETMCSLHEKCPLAFDPGPFNPAFGRLTPIKRIVLLLVLVIEPRF